MNGYFNDWRARQPANAPLDVPLLLIVLGGIWLIISPWVLGYAYLGQAFWNNIAVGALMIFLCGLRVAYPRESTGVLWWNMSLALWLVASPFILYYFYRPAAFWNDIGMGFALALLTAWSASLHPMWRAPRGGPRF